MQQKLYDVVIVGASDEGIEAAKYFFAKNLNILLISRHFDNFKRTFAKIPYLTGNVIFSGYMHGLIMLYLEDGSSICTKNVILATGTRHTPVKSDCKNGIYYNINSIKNTRKYHKLVIIDDTEAGVKHALLLATKFKEIYICTKLLKLPISEELKQKLQETPNIHIMPLCSVKEFVHNNMNVLYKVILDTYAEVPCQYVLASTNRIAEVPCLSKGMIEIDQYGYYIVNKHYGSKLVPGVFAIGACTGSNDKIKFGNILLK